MADTHERGDTHALHAAANPYIQIPKLPSANLIIRSFTFGFSSFVIRFTNQFTILHEVKFVSRVQLSAANYTREALQMINEILRPSNNLSRRYAQITAGALRAKPPGANLIKTPLQRDCYGFEGSGYAANGQRVAQESRPKVARVHRVQLTRKTTPISTHTADRGNRADLLPYLYPTSVGLFTFAPTPTTFLNGTERTHSSSLYLYLYL